MKKHISIILTAAAVVLLAATVGFPCQIRLITGVPCPTCGMTRSIVSLLHGDIAAAMYYHPLFWFVPLVILVPAIMNNRRHKKIIFAVAMVIYLTVYAVRMLTLFPDTPPMELNRSAIVVKIIERIISK